jgi:hypothetical protein
LFLS